MRILVTNHFLERLGGSETFTFSLIEELKRQGHKVSFYTKVVGLVSEKIERTLKVSQDFNPKTKDYDLILANHYTCVDDLKKLGILIIQTCHGTTPDLEQPHPSADAYVAISEEVESHIRKKQSESDITVIYNGVNCNRFKPIRLLNKRVKKVLSLAHNEDFNKNISHEFKKRSIRFLTLNKYKNPVWQVENHINNADMVVSLGRGAYEAMACGRPVLIIDKRPYQDGMGDGLVRPSNFEKLMKKNCSGRTNRYTDASQMIDEALKYYSPELGNQMRNLAMEKLNMAHQVNKYMDLFKKLA